MTKIKICGLFRLDDADYINEAMPNYAGFILDYPKSHRNISLDFAGVLRNRIDSKIKTVGVFVNNSIESIANAANSGIIDIVQLHGSEDNEYIKSLRKLTKAEIWKSFVIKSASDIERARSSDADMILLDGGLGGGRMFDHDLIHSINREFILAGGIAPDNAAEVIEKIHPFCIDVSSGCETDKIKDKNKIISITNIVRNIG
ncbi:MAG: phosphoribosylanthranilate isomerase [Clostridia bacterium]|nr:phosphoribosylanthranilate isomerase [Clostridia bacterium]